MHNGTCFLGILSLFFNKYIFSLNRKNILNIAIQRDKDVEKEKKIKFYGDRFSPDCQQSIDAIRVLLSKPHKKIKKEKHENEDVYLTLFCDSKMF